MHEVVVLASPDCHLCEDALDVLSALASEFDLSVRKLDISSPEGSVLAERLRPPLLPAVIVDGELFSSGRLPRRKLRRHLERVA